MKSSKNNYQNDQKKNKTFETIIKTKGNLISGSKGNLRVFRFNENQIPKHPQFHVLTFK